jgi:hypothetical protein
MMEEYYIFKGIGQAPTYKITLAFIEDQKIAL